MASYWVPVQWMTTVWGSSHGQARMRCSFPYDRPSFLFALLFNDLSSTSGEITRQHWLAAAWTPNEMIDDEMHPMLIALVLKLVCILHSLTIHNILQICKG
jgi:hypothetical protein